MAYTDATQVQNLIGVDLYNAILTASEGSISFTQMIADADAEIDARLRQRYLTPFAQLADAPATPALIQTISRYMVCANLYARHRPEQPHAMYFASKAEQLLDGLLDGRFEIAAALQPSSAQARGFRVKRSDPVFAGVDVYGKQRIRDW
jgi:hypothetical protein